MTGKPGILRLISRCRRSPSISGMRMSTSAQQFLAPISASKNARAESNAKVRYLRRINKTSDSRTSTSSSMTQTVRSIVILVVRRNIEAKNRAAAGIGFQPQTPSVSLDDTATYAQSHAHAIGLIRYKWLEQSVAHILRYARTGVGNGNLQQIRPGPADSNDQLAPA